MLEVLLGLALVPFAIWGLIILGAIAWKLAPYFLLPIAGAVAYLMYNDVGSREHAFIPAIFFFLILGWILKRWAEWVDV